MSGTTSLTAVQYGVGPIGARVATSALDRGADFVGAIDIDPEKIGTDLGTILDVDTNLGVTVTDDPSKALADSPDIVFHSTVSSLDAAADQLITAMEAGSNVISTTEELTYPWQNNRSQAEQLNEIAKENNVSCLGAGINPGFVMDTLPAVLSTPLQSVNSVRINRVQDAGQRRGPLQEKVGAGLTEDEFQSEIVEGAGHVGSAESIALLAAALGWSITDITESTEPVLADSSYDTGYTQIAEGDVAGVKQTAVGFVDQEERISLDLRMFVGADPSDMVEIDGNPTITTTVEGGYHGDTCTSAVVANVAPRVIAADPGLQTMIDIQTPTYYDSYH